MKLKKIFSRDRRFPLIHLVLRPFLIVQGWWSKFSSPETLPPNAPQAQKEAVRRGQLTSQVLLIMLSVELFYTPTILALSQPLTTTISLGVFAFLIFAASLNQRCKTTLAGFIAITNVEISLVAIIVTFPAGLNIIILPMLDFLLVPTLLAVSLLPPWAVFPAALTNIGVIFFSVFFLPKAADVQAVLSSNPGAIVGIPVLLQCIIAGISFLWARGSVEAIKEASRADTLDHLYREQSLVARTDALTGLLNHRAIIQLIEQELVLCQTNHHNCAIIFVDVDYFKHINDTWGHGAGDLALCTVGERLRKGVRKGDSVGRYGGEEFAILLSEIDQPEAFELAERLCCSIAETPCIWQQEKIQPVVSISLTASFGLAVYPQDGHTEKDLITMADNAMYVAKRTGRNRVCLPDRKSPALASTNENEAHSQPLEDPMLQTLSAITAFHDPETQAHADRMVALAEATMRKLGRSEEEVVLLHLATQLHDIGKIGVPNTILRKPNSLTEEEWSIMRRHPQIGEQILTQAKGQFGLVSHIVVAHHERWDGQGYPYGLKQDEIPLGARILSVIDSYDAMVSTRPYRKALSTAMAREELQRCAGTQFDPQVVATFLQALDAQEQQPREPEAAEPFSSS